MSAILTPVGLLLIILAGYLFKRFGFFTTSGRTFINDFSTKS